MARAPVWLVAVLLVLWACAAVGEVRTAHRLRSTSITTRSWGPSTSTATRAEPSRRVPLESRERKAREVGRGGAYLHGYSGASLMSRLTLSFSSDEKST